MEDIKNLLKESMANESRVVEGEILDDEEDYIEEASRELAYKVLNIHSLQGELAENLQRSKKYAKNSKTI